MDKKGFNLEQDFMANKFADTVYDDALEPNEDDIVVKFMAEQGEGYLFKDGSMLKFTDEYQAGMEIKKPTKEMEIGLDLVDDKTEMTILDNRYHTEIGSRTFNSNLRRSSISPDEPIRVSMLDPDFNEEGFIGNKALTDLYLEEIGIDKKDLKSINDAVKTIDKNRKQENKIGGILDMMRSKGKQLFGKESNKIKQKSSKQKPR